MAKTAVDRSSSPRCPAPRLAAASIDPLTRVFGMARAEDPKGLVRPCLAEDDLHFWPCPVWVP
jgi:hypothetical protein